MAAKAEASADNDKPVDAIGDQPDPIMYDITKRESLEIVIAFVGPVASGVTTACNQFKDILEREFKYDVHYHRVSSIIEKTAHTVAEVIPANLDRNDRIETYQKIGNKLREKHGAHYLVDKTIENTGILRKGKGGYAKNRNGQDVPIPWRAAHIIDSLKNPAEVDRLKRVYGNLFWLVTVFAPEDIRALRLTEIGMTEVQAKDTMDKDESDSLEYGQNVRATAHRADYFIRNDRDTTDNLRLSCDRFIKILFGVGLHTPTSAENGMLKAATAAVKSACLSRQVGASIYDRDGELLGTGFNDVPQADGGLYGEIENGSADNRCFRWKGKICHNDIRKEKLYNSVAQKLLSKKLISQDQLPDTIAAVKTTAVKGLIEFSRSVHAEMEAIVSVARNGSGSTRGGTLYTTTFPCHSCARHIVAAGIKTVFYIEPYSKSLALDLHGDAISVRQSDNGKVHFLQYEGVSPATSVKLFSSIGRERKSNGKFADQSPETAEPIFPSQIDSYITNEGLVIQQLDGL